MSAPAPGRRNHSPNFVKAEDNDVLDIGWAERVLSDGRPFRAECWCQDQATILTLFFLCTAGLEGAAKPGGARRAARPRGPREVCL